jgi:hypothetical protein
VSGEGQSGVNGSGMGGGEIGCGWHRDMSWCLQIDQALVLDPPGTVLDTRGMGNARHFHFYHSRFMFFLPRLY